MVWLRRLNNSQVGQPYCQPVVGMQLLVLEDCCVNVVHDTATAAV